MKVKITFTGTAPLLMHNPRLADPLDTHTRELKTYTGKRVKTDEDYETMSRLEFYGGLYITEGTGPYMPGFAIEATLVNGARITKQGKQVERGLFVTDDAVPVLYRGPRTAEEMWAAGTFRSVLQVRVGTKRVSRTRPIFTEWVLEANAEMDPGQLNLDKLQTIATDAGAMVGIGDYRPRYGRFSAVVEAT